MLIKPTTTRSAFIAAGVYGASSAVAALTGGILAASLARLLGAPRGVSTVLLFAGMLAVAMLAATRGGAIFARLEERRGRR